MKDKSTLRKIILTITPGFVKESIKTIMRNRKKRLKIKTFTKDIGENTHINESVQVLGWNNVTIGSNSVICKDVVLNVNVRNDKNIVIGNNCWIGQRTYISPGKCIDIGDYALFGEECKLLGADHLFDDPMKPYVTTGTNCEKNIVIGTNVWLGASVTIVGDVRIGHGSIIGAGALVTKDIPPFSLAVGNPARVIKRYDFNAKQWLTMEDYREQEVISNDEYLEILKRSYRKIDLPVIASGHDQGDLLF